MRTHDRLNILCIMADQWRHDWLGCAGAGWVNTPHIDSIAARGTRFTQCTTNSPVCAPARIALASGLNPHRLGAVDNHAYFPLRTPTLYQRFRDNSYYTGLVGKLDLAKPDPYNGLHGDRPCNYSFGFTHPVECEGKMHAGKQGADGPIGPYTQHLHDHGWLDDFVADYTLRAKRGWSTDHRDSVLPTEGFEDVFIGQRAVRWLDETPGDFPFHLLVSFVGPHDPFDPPTEYAGRTRDRAMPDPAPLAEDQKPASILQKQKQRERQGRTPEQIVEARRQYTASCECIDDRVGALLEALERKGVADRTIVVFCSDHGEMLGDHGLYTKAVPYEASIRVPMMLAGPGIEAGVTSDAMVELIDLNPTLGDLAGLPAQHGIDARSFAPVLRGDTAERREDTFSTIRGFRLIRTPTHKLVEHENDRDELFELAEDPDEQHNLIGTLPEVERGLRGRIRRRWVEGQWQR